MRIEMSNKTTAAKIGRPATGPTKGRPSITMDGKLMEQAKQAAWGLGISFSAFVEQSVAENLAALVANTEAAP
jgi:hypothetical protein